MFEIFLTVLALAIQGGGSGETAQSEATVTAQAEETAPAALVAEPQEPTGKFTTATEVRPILNATKGNWIAVREFDGKDLVYVTHLWTWRCGLLEMRVGINGAAPEIWPLPDCHMDQPMPGVVLEQDGLPYRSFDLGSVQSIDVQITYDDLGTDAVAFDRSQVLMP